MVVMRNVFSQVVGQTTGQVYPQNVCLWLNLLHTNCLQKFLCKLIVNSLCWTLKCLAQLLSMDMPMDIQVCSVCSGLRWEWGIVPSKLTVCRCDSSSRQVNKTKNFNRTNWSIRMVAWLQLNPFSQKWPTKYRISPDKIISISSTHEMRMKKKNQLGDY